MGVGVWLCSGCWCVQALHGAQGTASVSGGVRSGQLTPLQGQVTTEIEKKNKEDQLECFRNRQQIFISDV